MLSAEAFYTDSDIRWFGVDGREPEWHGRDNRIGCMILEDHTTVPTALCLLFNATLHPCRFVLPRPPGGQWRIAIDTAQASPADAPDEQGEVGEAINLLARTSLVLTC